MTAGQHKLRRVLLIAVGALLLTAVGAFAVSYTVQLLSYERTLNQYLTPYGEKATAYLAENEAFTEEYGEVSLHADLYSYSFLDPGTYTRLSPHPELPATAERFEAELSHLTVSVDLPDLRTVNVLFERTPEGGLEITGWEYADE